jgi:hypothetical protein
MLKRMEKKTAWAGPGGGGGADIKGKGQGGEPQYGGKRRNRLKYSPNGKW